MCGDIVSERSNASSVDGGRVAPGIAHPIRVSYFTPVSLQSIFYAPFARMCGAGGPKMAQENLVALRSRVVPFGPRRPQSAFYRYEPFPDGTGEPCSDCWPDNASCNSAQPLPEAVLEANSPRRVLLECATVVLVFAGAGALANLLI
jgi:hypothetical protein